MYDVIAVGSATVDVFVDTNAELITIRTKDKEEEMIAYPTGTKMLINRLQFSIGGGGTNTAVSFARLGLKTAYCGCLGKDANTDQVLTLLKKEKIDFIGEKKDGQSGYSVILDSIADDRTILTYKGTNSLFAMDGLPLGKLKAKWFYFCAFVDNSYKELEKLGEFAKKNNIKVAFNPSSYLAEQGKQYLGYLLQRTHLLILNKEEAEMIVGKGDIPSTLIALAALGPKMVVVTDGPHPMHAYDADKGVMYSTTPPKTTVVETTGAGDAFGSSFLTGLILKGDLQYAITLAIINSQSVLKYHGAKEKLLTRKEAEAAMHDAHLHIDMAKIS